MKQFISLFVFIALSPLFIPLDCNSLVIHADQLPIGTTGDLFELSSSHNVVMHVTITADGAGDILESVTADNYYYFDPADDSDISAAYLWYVANDSLGVLNTTTANYLGSMTYSTDRGGPGWVMSGLSQPVVDNSAIYITVDIPLTATVGRECAFTIAASKIGLQNSISIPPSEGPIDPPIIYISSFFPASPLNVNYSKTGQVNLSTNQAFTPLTLTIDNIGSTAAATAPIWLQGITVTVRDQSSIMIAPDLALQKIGFFGIGPNGPIYGEVTAIPSSSVPIYIPFSTTITVANDITLDVFATTTANTATAIGAFSLEIEQSQSFAASDSISLRTVSTQAAAPDSFPFQSDLFSLRYAVSQVQIYHTPILFSNDSVLKGETNVTPMGFTFINPGITNTAHADVSKISLTVTDGSNNPLIPNTVFSRIAISGQSITYGELTSIPGSSNLIVIPLSNSFISIPVYQPITATVVVDILPNATATEFKLTLNNSSAITAQDGNSQLIVPITAAYASDPFPMSSAVIPIATSFNITGLSIAPLTVYPKQQCRILQLTVNHPGPSNVGNLLMHGITITAKDENNNLMAINQDLASLFIRHSNAQILGLAAPGAQSALYINFTTPLQIAPFTTVVLTLELNARSSFDHKLIKLAIDSNNDISVTQPSDPTRTVFVAGQWPTESTLISLGGGEGELYLSNYPNPFAAGYQNTTIAWYLGQSATVTIKLFTLNGNIVQTLVNNQYRSAGAHTQLWNGRTSTGGAVKNGVYMLRIEALPVSYGNKIIQLRKIAVVK